MSSITLTKRVEDIDISPDQSRIIVASSDMVGRSWCGGITFLDADFSKPEVSIASYFGINAVTFLRAPEKTKVWATGGDDGSVSQWRPGKDKPSLVGSEHNDMVSSLASGTGGLLSSSYDKSIKLWSTEVANSSATFTGHLGAVTEVRWQPDQSEVFASSSVDGTSKLWDKRTGRRESSTITLGECVHSLDWSFSSVPLIAFGSNGASVRVYDSRNTAVPVTEEKGTGGPCRRVRFSKFEKDILAATSENSGKSAISILDLSSENKLKNSIECHSGAIRALCFHPSRGILYSGGWDKNVVKHMSLYSK